MLKYLTIYKNKSLFMILLFGLNSGLTLLLSGNTLNFWLSRDGVSNITVGLFSLAATPYVFKFIIAQFIDKMELPYVSKIIGNKKSWHLTALIFLIISMVIIGLLNPVNHIVLTAILGFCIALFSVIQDVVLDSYRLEILDNNTYGTGSATYTFGYRIGMLISGGGAIYISIYLPWGTVYHLMALVLLVLSIPILLYKETRYEVETYINKINLIFLPFQHFKSIKNIGIIILFILLYRISDNFISVMINPFLIKANFSEIEIATASKTFGTVATIIGGFIGGSLISKLNIYKSLYVFGIIHVAGHALLLAQNIIGHNIIMLYLMTGAEALTGGMVMIALIAFISKQCSGKYAASQYALLTSFMGLSRVLFPSISGFLVSEWGWNIFFIFMIILSLPGLLLIRFLPKS
jgi:MFS transporter, PAT family, beta-lactamase induction signal transducer AmpG